MNAVANLTLLDFAMMPLYLAFIYAIAFYVRKKYYPPGHQWRKYFIPGLSVKLFGAIFIGLVYAYYYKGGDTYYYFNQAQIINSSFSESFTKWFNLVFHLASPSDPEYYKYIQYLEWYYDTPSYFVCSITAVLSIFTFNCYLPTAALFALLSFTGVWALFRTFSRMYPHITAPVATTTLFIPSLFVWGSGIFKDTICILGLGWLTYATFRLLTNKDFSARNILTVILSFWLISNIKVYIIISFAPALLLWIMLIYSKSIGNRSLRFLFRFMLSAVLIALVAIGMNSFADEMGKYSIDNLATTSNTTRAWITYASEQTDGSAYDLGEFDPSITGMLTKLPAAVNVTLFRPYLWEANKVIVLLSALESFILFIITLKLLFQLGFKKIFRAIVEDPTIQFCFTFAIIFAFAVGISSYNFGALSRYKIPCMPFFVMGLLLTYYRYYPAEKPFAKFLRL